MLTNGNPARETMRRAIEDELDELLRLQAEDAGELLLVRHAEPARSQGQDPMLSCAGLAQAERLAERLSSSWVHAVYCSPERRAQQTARIIAGPGDRAVHVLEGLDDIAFDPERVAPDSLSCVARFESVPRWDSLPGFECGRLFRRRTIQAIERMLAISAGQRIVLVTHANAINAYVSMLLSIPADRFFTPEHTAVTTLRWRDGRYALRCLNDLSHLSALAGVSVGSQLFTVR